MSKKNIAIVLVVVSLGAIAIYFSQKDQKSTVSDLKASYSFSVKDTAAIAKIILKDKTPRKVELLRGQDHWLVNNQSPARKDAIEVLLETLYRMEMRNFVQKNAVQPIKNRIDVYGTEVQVLDKDGKTMKHFYVGTETADNLGTHMMMKGADLPFAVHILGFNGYLNTRFFTSDVMWKDRSIWGFDNLEITHASVNYAQHPEWSFGLKINNNQIVLTNGNGNEVPSNPATLQQNAAPFLASFRNAKFEGAIVETDPIFARKDSLLILPPYITFSATNKKGITHTLKAYQIKAAPETYGDDGLPMQFDPDRMHAFVDDKDFVLVQYFGLKNLLKTRPDFVD